MAHCRRRLQGRSSGGLIRIIAKNADSFARISIFNNAAALVSYDDPSHSLSWPLERQLTGNERDLVRTVMGHFGGQWSVETREKIGTVWTLAFKNA